MIMTYSSYRVKVPGKLLIAGEYSILEPNQQAIVIAIDRYVSAYIEPSKQNEVSIPQLGLNSVTWKMNNKVVQFNKPDSRLQFIQNAIGIAHQYLQEKSIEVCPFYLTIKSELNDPLTGRKYGLGSSAAVTVAVISAMLALSCQNRTQPTLEEIFKLSAVSHLKTQKNGSGIDIAASTFGGWICYSSFDPKWVMKELQQSPKLTDFINKPWPNLSIRPLKQPSKLKLCVGWTNEEAATAPMINEFKKFRVWNKESYIRFLDENSRAVARLLKSFEEDDCLKAISSLNQNRKALVKLSEDANITIETTMLKKLCQSAEKYGSGKSSGAGGGDCGIAFLSNEEHKYELHKVWTDVGLIPLNINVSQFGALATEYNCRISLKEYLSS
jgi:phosphomevalonate kinase